MPRYTVFLTREITESCSETVEAATEDEAEEAVVALLRSGVIRFAVDDSHHFDGDYDYANIEEEE